MNLKNFLKYAFMNIFGMLGLSISILADTLFIANGIGTNGLTALNLALPIFNLIQGTGLMIGMGAGIKYSIHKNDDQKYINKIFTNTMYIVIFISLIFIFVALFFSDPLVKLLGADQAVFDMTKEYFKTILILSPAFILNNVLICFIRNDGYPQLSMAAMIIGSILTVIIEYFLIFIVKTGMFGAALAAALVHIISIIILSFYFLFKKNKFHISKCKLDKNISKDIIVNGVPSLISELSSAVITIVFNYIILRQQGNIGIAAYGIIANISLVMIAIYTGLAQGIQPIISMNYGIHSKSNVKNILKYAIITLLIISVIIYSSIFVFSSQITEIFNGEGNDLLRSIAIPGLKLYFLACPFVGFNILMSNYFTSTEHARPAHIVSILRGFIVIIPSAFILAYIWNNIGIWCAFPLTEILVCFVSAFLFNKLNN